MEVVQSSRVVERAPGPGKTGLLQALRQVVAVVFLGLAPIIATAVVLCLAVGDDPAFDFHQFWQGGRDVVHGVSPYQATGTLPDATTAAELDPHGIRNAWRFPYPAPAAVALAPFGALPFTLAAVIFTALLLAATPAALLVLGVRDWRCHGVACLSTATIGAVRLGALTPLLLLGLALSWRYRDRARVLVPVLAAVISLKLFLWPLVVWLAATGRMRSALWTAAVAVFGTLAAWGAIGFKGLREYPELLDKLAQAVQGQSYSTSSLWLALGLPQQLAPMAGAATGAVAIGLTFIVVRRSAVEADERAMTGALIAALVMTPILWVHYFMLLFLPLALFRRSLSLAWFVPLIFWVTPGWSDGDVWRILLVLGTAAATIAASMMSRAAAGPAGLEDPAVAR